MPVDRSPFVLVLDDHAEHRRLIEVVLQRAGHEVHAIDNVPEALDIMASGEAGLVILDLMMPHVSGWDLLTIRAADPMLRAIPVIVVSASGAFGGLDAYKYGVFAVVQKPFEPAHLQSVAASALAFGERRGLRETQ